MTTYLALLRAINVAGHKQVSMADLRDLVTALGFGAVQSLLQSGNLVFRARTRPRAALERVLEEGARTRLGLETGFFVRTAEEWQGVIARNPFRKEAERDPGRLVVFFMKDAPKAKDVTALQSAITGPEVVRANGTEAYIVYPIGQGRSRLTNALIQAKLGTRGTARNWNTVLRLGALAGDG